MPNNLSEPVIESETVAESSHTGEGLFKCGQCQYAATTKTSLQVHLRTHTGEKPYKCDHCSYASANASIKEIALNIIYDSNCGRFINELSTVNHEPTIMPKLQTAEFKLSWGHAIQLWEDSCFASRKFNMDATNCTLNGFRENRLKTSAQNTEKLINEF
ncbi:zinc-finger double domain-containing protein [Ditylenchus destructor]|nr:zinc-finger double domain-containing protein [Ditylenchus destructor]